jgi:minichromosome maintenance protein 10
MTDVEIARRKILECENEDLKRRLAQAATGGSSGANRLPMTDVSNLMKNAMGSSSLGGPKTAPKPNTTVSGASKTQQLFGCSAPSAIKSRFMGDAEEEDHDSMMKTMEALEERDQLANQLAMKRETKVKVFHCTTCKKKTRFFDAETCRAHRDAVKEVESIMRYFKCKGCNRTNTSFDALFPKNCERSGCTSVSFERVTAADVTAAAKPTKSDMESARGELASREAMAPRGVEHGFRLDTIRGD